MTSEEVQAKIEAGIGGAKASVRDTTGTGDHFEATVISAAFRGKSLIQQHRLVYAALGDALTGPIHALKLETRSE